VSNASHQNIVFHRVLKYASILMFRNYAERFHVETVEVLKDSTVLEKVAHRARRP